MGYHRRVLSVIQETLTSHHSIDIFTSFIIEKTLINVGTMCLNILKVTLFEFPKRYYPNTLNKRRLQIILNAIGPLQSIFTLLFFLFF